MGFRRSTSPETRLGTDSGTMIVAIMGSGILAGLLTFAAALIVGQSLLSAFALYVVAGTLTSLLVAAGIYFRSS
jgi:hypothetical protein